MTEQEMGLRLEPYTLAAYGLSDTGLVRKNNEDVWGCLPEHHLFVLADGMGGHQAGEVAAREATYFLLTRAKELLDEEKVSEMAVPEAADVIRLLIAETNRFVHSLSKTHGLLNGMGTTLLCLYFHDDSVIYAHVGDSRIYRLQKGVLEQLTKDHSLLRELIEKGGLSERQLEDSTYRNIITRAIGTELFVEPTVNIAPVIPGDLYLLCSDGLSDLLSHEEISQVLSLPLTVEEKVRTLIALAKRKGAHDNVTAVLAEVKESNARQDIP